MLIHSTHLMPRYSLRVTSPRSQRRSTLIIQKILCSCCLDYRCVWRRRNQSLNRTLREAWAGRRQSESSHIYCSSLMTRRILESFRLLTTNWCEILMVNVVRNEFYRERKFIKSGRTLILFLVEKFHWISTRNQFIQVFFNLFFIFFSFIHLVPLLIPSKS